MAHWHRYIALGDSNALPADDRLEGGLLVERGWAHRLAGILDGNARLQNGAFEFADLTVPMQRMRQLVDYRVELALTRRPDLVSIAVGTNDLAMSGSDPDALATQLESSVARIRGAGADVLLATCFDQRFAFYRKPLRRRASIFNANVWSIARSHGTFTLDLWGMRELRFPGMWSDDGVRLTTAGHRLLAKRAAHALGVAYAEIGGQSSEQEPSIGSLHGFFPGSARLDRLRDDRARHHDR